MSEADIDWHEWFRRNIAARGGLFKLMLDNWVFCSPLYDMLLRLFPPPKKILDIGCGYGLSTIPLACMGYKVTGLDVDKSMLRKGMMHASLFERVSPNPINFAFGDTFDLGDYYGRFDLAFSSGVLEHFRPLRAVDALREQAKTAKHVVVVIPTKYLSEPLDGYRYPHTLQSLKRVCIRAGLSPAIDLTFGNPSQQSLVTLRRFCPDIIWTTVFRRIFATAIALICNKTQSF